MFPVYSIGEIGDSLVTFWLVETIVINWHVLSYDRNNQITMLNKFWYSVATQNTCLTQVLFNEIYQGFRIVLN